jgi:hypothetical protein
LVNLGFGGLFVVGMYGLFIGKFLDFKIILNTALEKGVVLFLGAV